MNRLVSFFRSPTKETASTSISYLTDASWENTVPFVPPVTSGKVIKVYDGDTITIAAKLPHDTSPVYRFSVRLTGIDTPEIKGSSTREKELAKKARTALSEHILGKIVYLEDVSTEKYGRLLATVFYENTNLNQWMLDNKYAVPYDGGTKQRPEDWGLAVAATPQMNALRSREFLIS